jgi:hypothetical protein
MSAQPVALLLAVNGGVLTALILPDRRYCIPRT